MTSPPSLLNMPDVVMKKILDNTDTKSIFVLQKVCHTLRNFIDDYKPDICLLEIELKATTYGFTFTISSNTLFTLRVKYLKTAMACPRTRENGVLLEHDYPMPVFLADVGRLLDFQKSKLLDIGLILKYEKYEAEYEQMLNFVGNRLALKQKQLKVERLWMSANSQWQVCHILSNLEADRITVRNAITDYKRNGDIPMGIEEIVELKQFKSAEKFDMSRFLIDDENAVEHFLNISEVSIYVKSITKEDLVMIKEKYLNPNSAIDKYSSFDLKYKEFEEVEEFIRSMGAPSISYYGDQWFFRNQNFSRVVCIQHNSEDKCFSIFLQDSDDDVLKDAIVQLINLTL